MGGSVILVRVVGKGGAGGKQTVNIPDLFSIQTDNNSNLPPTSRTKEKRQQEPDATLLADANERRGFG